MSYLLAGLKEEVERSGIIRECEGGRSLNSKRYALVEDFQQQVVNCLEAVERLRDIREAHRELARCSKP